MLITIPEGWRPLDKKACAPDPSPFGFSGFRFVRRCKRSSLECGGSVTRNPYERRAIHMPAGLCIRAGRFYASCGS
jgi:hypothetical protein